ncbi:MAG: hypothetical protein L0Y44_00880 [Phycisphaerales bacterium]|nr:hypothetical protein [Phycisphaerales bacterium]MCI0629192.1 hypothetical protein [Phycisphaerales bacterium]MCI0677267.1 hypothetical protein [Phycisphaerales bacterium]
MATRTPGTGTPGILATDRNRLKEVHQSDLTEGRINQDFVDWLQTKGMSYLLAALIVLCGYFAWVRWSHHRTNYQTEAWQNLQSAQLPSSFEDVAQRYSDVGAVPQLARINAAQQLLAAVQTGKTLGADTEAKKDLTPDERAAYLDRADGLFGQVVQTDDGSDRQALLIVKALTGRAAIAESKGNATLAKQYHNQAAQRVEALFPELAAQSRRRADAVQEHPQLVSLPTQADVASLQQQSKPVTLDPVAVDPWVYDLVMPKESD